jgi:hypothetical protein
MGTTILHGRFAVGQSVQVKGLEVDLLPETILPGVRLS